MGVPWSRPVEWLGAAFAAATVPPWLGAALALLVGLVLVLIARMLVLRAGEIKKGAVQDRETTFRTLADSMPQIVWTAWPDGRIDFLNRRWFELTGLTDLESRDDGWSRVLHPDDRQTGVDRWHAANASGEPFEIESRLLDQAKGVYRWHLSRTSPLRDEAGRIIKWVGTATDIEDQKRAEAALRELHIETAAVLESITDAHFTLDRDWRFIDIGESVAERLGKSREALVGRSIWEVFPETIGGAFHDHFQHAMREGVAVHFEAQSIANGQWYEGHVFPSEAGLSVYARDITERVKAKEGLHGAYDEMERRVRERTVELAEANTILHEEAAERRWAEKALRESEAVLRGFYDGVAMAMGVVEVREHDLLCLSANPTSARFLGVEPGVLEGSRATRLGLSYEVIAVFRKHCRESERAGRPVRFEYELALPTCPRWLSFTVHAIAGAPEGRPWFSFVAEDVTDRKHAEAAVRDSEGRYRLLFESNPHPIWVFDVETFAFLAVNEAAVRHYGYSREEFLASTIAMIRPPEDVSRVVGLIRDCGSRDYNSSDVWRHYRKDGRILDVEVTSRSITFQGRPARVVLANDVTERCRAEELLNQRNCELEALNAVAAGINRSLERPKVLATLERLLAEHLGTTGGAILESGRAAHFFSDIPDETPPPAVMAEIKHRLRDRHLA
ncbi:MAG: PAS domain S-box protein, partial [Isosphaeraceae bacterium]